MTTLIVTIHVIACVALIILVLLQSGKEGMGVIFGGGSQSVFGSTGAGGLLVRLSAIFGAVFLITSLAYNYTTGVERRPAAKSVMMDVQVEDKAAPAPADAQTEKPKGLLFEESAAKPEAAKTEAVAPEAAKPEAASSAAVPTEEKKDEAPKQ